MASAPLKDRHTHDNNKSNHIFEHQEIYVAYAYRQIRCLTKHWTLKHRVEYTLHEKSQKRKHHKDKHIQNICICEHDGVLKLQNAFFVSWQCPSNGYGNGYMVQYGYSCSFVCLSAYTLSTCAVCSVHSKLHSERHFLSHSHSFAGVSNAMLFLFSFLCNWCFYRFSPSIQDWIHWHTQCCCILFSVTVTFFSRCYLHSFGERMVHITVHWLCVQCAILDWILVNFFMAHTRSNGNLLDCVK